MSAPRRPSRPAPRAASALRLQPPVRWSDERMRASLAASLAHWDGRSPLWVFGYGSLIWKPEFEFEARRAARVHGYHRRLCLHSVHYRGTHDCPGIVAGLDRGGSCLGMAYRVAAAHVPEVFRQLWEREMFLGSYRPTWVRAHLRGGGMAEALAFVVRRDAYNYSGRLSEKRLLGILVRAQGIKGTSLDYLQRTVAALHEAGLRDPHLERLAQTAARRVAGGRP